MVTRWDTRYCVKCFRGYEVKNVGMISYIIHVHLRRCPRIGTWQLMQTLFRQVQECSAVRPATGARTVSLSLAPLNDEIIPSMNSELYLITTSSGRRALLKHIPQDGYLFTVRDFVFKYFFEFLEQVFVLASCQGYLVRRETNSILVGYIQKNTHGKHPTGYE